MFKHQANLILFDDFSRAIQNGVGTCLRWISTQLLLVQTQGIFGVTGIKFIQHNFEPAVFFQICRDDAVDLLAPRIRIAPIAANGKGAEIGHQAHIAGTIGHLRVRSVHAKCAREKLHGQLWVGTGFSRERLNHATRRIAIQLRQRSC